jgi:hypothetical protein
MISKQIVEMVEVTMMYTAELRDGDHLAAARWLYWTKFETFLDEAERRRGAAESPLDSKPGSNFAFANRPASKRALNQDSKWKFRFYWNPQRC